MKKVLFFASLFFLLASCSREYYQTASYETYSANHHLVAVLPVQTITTGRIPARLTEEDLLAIEEGESQAFQVALYNELAKRSGSRAQDIKLDFQHYSQTNAMLNDKGVSIRESWDMAPVELAKILEVDAVILTSLEKEYYLTDLESFGISLAFAFVDVFSDNWFLFPNNRTSDVMVSCTIIDGKSGVPVWVTDRICPTNWSHQHNEVVEQIARSCARRFPYRY